MRPSHLHFLHFGTDLGILITHQCILLIFSLFLHGMEDTIFGYTRNFKSRLLRLSHTLIRLGLVLLNYLLDPSLVMPLPLLGGRSHFSCNVRELFKHSLKIFLLDNQQITLAVSNGCTISSILMSGDNDVRISKVTPLDVQIERNPILTKCLIPLICVTMELDSSFQNKENFFSGVSSVVQYI